MIMCPETDTKNFLVQCQLGLGKPFHKGVRICCDLEDRCHIPCLSGREDPGSLSKEKKIGMGIFGERRRY